MDIKILPYVMLYIMMPNNIRTHTYWMSVKEYKKHSKHRENEIKLTGDKIITRTHIYFK